MIRPADVFQGMKTNTYFSKTDLIKSYWHIPVRQEVIPKTAFVIMDRHLELLRVPNGMMNLGATLTCAVKVPVRGMNHVMNYVDDLLI
ncbi:retrovirus-related pol polyprotein from transposon 297 [Plakobranchus ocellatus]|uniref:Retrovirus-related pol polyprotein from transposon 297 n=1 Tax=Plakobranchus ocellatus TaxID=259542 RepID=A0AAV3YJ43_9GAST|nr:retrovirus-related pol polyprotein from transposon 297 [Plakobranchus ocellatus]